MKKNQISATYARPQTTTIDVKKNKSDDFQARKGMKMKICYGKLRGKGTFFLIFIILLVGF